MKEYDIQKLFDRLMQENHSVSDDIDNSLNIIVKFSENQKGVLAVVITGLVYKHFHPKQDVRYHQKGLSGGYAGRSFDNRYITPFLKENNFPAMAESGWLTRSLEQASPYNKEYPGSISGRGVKDSFLHLYDIMQTGNCVEEILSCLFKKMVERRDKSEVNLSCPANLTISETLELIKLHIEYDYGGGSGASRLPNLAIYSAYKAILSNNKGRYKDKVLCDLESHTAADSSTGSIGDIQINDSEGLPFEGIEIKARVIKHEMIDTIYKKIQGYKNISRYYLLSTFEEIPTNSDLIKQRIVKIRAKHGCDVIVNGVYDTLKYFLRLCDTEDFIKFYVSSMQDDGALKYEHKNAWNELCGNLGN